MLFISNEVPTTSYEALPFPPLTVQEKSTTDIVDPTGSQLDMIPSEPKYSAIAQTAIENEQQIEQLPRHTDRVGFYNRDNAKLQTGDQIEMSTEGNQSSNEETQNITTPHMGPERTTSDHESVSEPNENLLRRAPGKPEDELTKKKKRI